tara:strand:+ start:222 stop:986 length:765 start_codon:yes stop_codon:yes gene_type:complete
MNDLLRPIILFLLLIQNLSVLICQDSNLFESATKVVLLEEGKEEFFYWELKNESHLWNEEIGNLSALNHYRDSLKLELGSKTYLSAIAKEARQNLEVSLIEKADRINALLVHTGSIGSLRQINNLEAHILNYQINRFPMLGHPTEFHGFILKNDVEGLIRIYFGSSDKGWPPQPTIIIKELEKLVLHDWKLIGHLHNHYCEKNENYIGILAPSLADAQYYKMLKERFNIEKALITNGFHSVEIENKDFEKFESH